MEYFLIGFVIGAILALMRQLWNEPAPDSDDALYNTPEEYSNGSPYTVPTKANQPTEHF